MCIHFVIIKGDITLSDIIRDVENQGHIELQSPLKLAEDFFFTPNNQILLIVGPVGLIVGVLTVLIVGAKC